MSVSASPSGTLRPDDTVELSGSQRDRLMDAVRDRTRGPGVRALGLAFLVVAGLLAYLLIRDPLGSIPGAEGLWKGTPMVLAAGFFGVYGALLLVLRRFSLASILAAVIVSAAFAAATQAFVLSILESEERNNSYAVPQERREAFIAFQQDRLTEAALMDFTADLQAAGYLPEGTEFEQVNIVIGVDLRALFTGAASPGQGPVEVSMDFRYCPFIHPRSSRSRYFAEAYAKAQCEWATERLSPHPDSLWVNRGKLLPPELETLCDHLTRIAPDLESHADALHWLAHREKDPQFREMLELFAKSVEVKQKARR